MLYSEKDFTQIMLKTLSKLRAKGFEDNEKNYRLVKKYESADGCVKVNLQTTFSSHSDGERFKKITLTPDIQIKADCGTDEELLELSKAFTEVNWFVNFCNGFNIKNYMIKQEVSLSGVYLKVYDKSKNDIGG